MNEREIKKAVADALVVFFRSPRGEAIVGNIVLKAIAQAFTIEITYEDGKTDPGRVVEKTETVHLRDWLAIYMPHIEAAMRGCQADAAAARNRSAATRDMMVGLVDAFGRLAHGEDARAAAAALAERHRAALIEYQEKNET